MLVYVIYYTIGNNKSNQIAILFRNTNHTHLEKLPQFDRGAYQSRRLKKAFSITLGMTKMLHGHFSHIRSLSLSGLGFYRACFLSQIENLIIKLKSEECWKGREEGKNTDTQSTWKSFGCMRAPLCPDSWQQAELKAGTEGPGAWTWGLKAAPAPCSRPGGHSLSCPSLRHAAEVRLWHHLRLAA